MSDTPKVDAFLRAENCSRDNPAAFDWLVGFARSLERELASDRADAQQRISEWSDLCEKADRENAELSDQLMRWFKAASPYATPGSLEEGLKKLERALVEAQGSEASRMRVEPVSDRTDLN
jgi:uncharacterized protein YigA (DUF484 family)